MVASLLRLGLLGEDAPLSYQREPAPAQTRAASSAHFKEQTPTEKAWTTLVLRDGQTGHKGQLGSDAGG